MKKLFTWLKPATGGWPYDVSPVDGRFLVIEPAGTEPGGPTEIVSVVFDWSSELTRLAPVNP